MNEEKKQITADMTIAQIMKEKPAAAAILTSKGMHCLGCVISRGETLKQAVEVHGISLDELLKEINEA